MSVSILRCPISGLDLELMDEEAVDALRGRAARVKVMHVTGGPVKFRLEAALATTDRRFIYPVVEDILILLPSLAIVDEAAVAAGAMRHLALDTESVMRFYDEVGWHQASDGAFEDTQRFEDVRPVSRDYVVESYMRVKAQLPPRGRYLLDVASGPIPYPEYISYSENYERRICVDVSIVALRAARQRLGDKGIYIQGDITQLPLKDGCVDGFVSLHTIYHVPAAKQATAFRELERVLTPEGAGVVVYSWGTAATAMEILTKWVRPGYTLKWLLRKVLPPQAYERLKTTFAGSAARGNGGVGKDEPQLFFHPHDYGWFLREVAVRPGWSLRVWRAASMPFLELYAHPRWGGRAVLALVALFERACPRLCGRFGQYPMLVYTKGRRLSPG